MHKQLWTLIFVFCVWFTIVNSVHARCSFPRNKLENGHIIYGKQSDATTAYAPEMYFLKFYCAPGYARIGARMSVCLKGKWSHKVPQCIEISCPDPPTIANGKYILNTSTNGKITRGSTAHYVCDKGHDLSIANSSLVCTLENKLSVWRGEVPECIPRVVCPNPGVSSDGTKTGNNYEGDEVNFSCNEGFELHGSDTIVCLPTGNWSSERPLCRPFEDHCELPPSIPNAEVEDGRTKDYYLPYEEVEITCKPGYKYSGPSKFVECLEDSEWEVEFEECIEFSCKRPGLLANGSIPELESTNVTIFPSKFQLTYVCDEGFRLIGNSWSFCEETGWSGEPPRCEIITCPDPGIPEYGYRKGDSFNIGDKVTFMCPTGFDLLGSVERFCMPNGQWTGDLAACNLPSNYCPNPGIPINGNKNNSYYELGERIKFRCNPGHILVGTEVRECLPEGIWSGDEVRCIGPYDYDNPVKVKDILLKVVEENSEDENKKFNISGEISSNSKIDFNSEGRAIDLNFVGRLIFYFIFDASSSVEEINFKKSIAFAKALTKKVGVSPDRNRVGAITFSSKAQINFLPLHYSTTDEVLEALDNLEYTGGGTAASSALSLIREGMLPLVEADENFGKKNIKSIIFILTDGKANMGGDPENEAKELKNGGLEIYSIGITGSIMKESLYKIASEPQQEHVFILQNYPALDFLIQAIIKGDIDYSKCGLGHDRFTLLSRARIIGGHEAPEPWPWIAALYIGTQNANKQLSCGGSIIHKSFILTAAHCLFRKDGTGITKDEINIELGLTNVHNKSNMQPFSVKKIYRHPKYSHGKTFDYDIALLHLDGTIQFNAFVRPVCLPTSEAESINATLYKPGELAVAIGWGHNEVLEKNPPKNSAKTTENLKELVMPIQPPEICLKTVNDHRKPDDQRKNQFTDRMFCAGNGQRGNDTCKGDSGGPIMQFQMDKEGNTYWTEVGIVSWGIGCGLENTYGYYTHVQRLKPWIQETISIAEKDDSKEDDD